MPENSGIQTAEDRGRALERTAPCGGSVGSAGRRPRARCEEGRSRRLGNPKGQRGSRASQAVTAAGEVPGRGRSAAAGGRGRKRRAERGGPRRRLNGHRAGEAATRARRPSRRRGLSQGATREPAPGLSASPSLSATGPARPPCRVHVAQTLDHLRASCALLLFGGRGGGDTLPHTGQLRTTGMCPPALRSGPGKGVVRSGRLPALPRPAAPGPPWPLDAPLRALPASAGGLAGVSPRGLSAPSGDMAA